MTIEHANGHRPEGLLEVLHPALEAAPRPDRDRLDYNLDAALDAVVRLHSEIPRTARTARTLGMEREGSGVVLDNHGLVLTIGYLITEANRVTLGLGKGRKVAAEPIAYDHETGFGMVRAMEALDVEPLHLGDSTDARPGDETVIASFGGFRHAISGNIVSRREFAGSWEYLLDEAFYTAPMHPYWGGAALIDRSGMLIGTGSLYVQESLPDDPESPGNMFVPINLLKPIFDDMVNTGRTHRAARPWLGMHTAEAGERLIVTGVSSGAPAEQAGIEPGDVILSAEGVPVKSLGQMYRTIWGAGEAGAEIRFAILREDDVLSIRVRSGDRYSYLELPRRH